MEALGDILRKAREDRGISLEEAARRTKLTRDVLRALEEDAPERLSSPSYAAIFQKSYARYLGLDLHTVRRRITRDETEVGGAVSGVEHEAVRRHPALPSLPLSGAGVASLILVAFVVVLALVMRGDRGEGSAPVETGPPAAAVGTVAPEPPTSLVVRATADVALRVERAGALVWDGVLTAGDRRTFDATSPTKLIVSEPAALAVFAGGRRILLPESRPAEIVWPPPGATGP